MSRAFHLRRPAPTSTTMLAIFLFAIVALACVLAIQAYGAARSHRATTEAVLTDYAGIAASEFGRLARDHIFRVSSVAFDEIPRRYRPGRMPDPVQVRWELDDAAYAIRCPCPSLKDPRLVFRADLLTGASDFEGDLSEGEARAVTATVRAHLASSPPERYQLVGLDGDGVPPGRIALLATVFDSADVPVTVYGAVLEDTALHELAEHWYEEHALLPAAITRGSPESELVRVELWDAGGTSMYASHEQGADGPVAEDILDPYLGAMRVEASIRADAADRLVIGGLPSSRLPFSLALLGLTLVVGAAGLWEVRKHQQLARLREDFISSVSHELRTPLAQIRMLAELQADRKLRTDEERERANRIMAKESRRLTQLVENILHFSRSRAAPAVTAPRQRVAVSECAHDVVETFRPLMDPHLGTVEVDVPKGLVTLANRDTLRQILSNLLDNALKYGPPGQTVRVRGEQHGGVVRLLVDDEGPGVPEAEREAIWEPYVRLPRDVDSHRPGSGVGLAVVRTLAQEVGAKVHVEDAPGGGARFVVELTSADPATTHGASAAEKPMDASEETAAVGAHPAH